jgi:hypothetical protein
MEAMAIEQLILRAWELEGFWGRTRQRVPLRGGGNWPELDVVAVRSLDNGNMHVRFGESKVQMGANYVHMIDDDVLKKGGDVWLRDWAKFCETVAEVYQDDIPKIPGLPPWERLEKVELVLVFNGWGPLGSSARAELEKALKNRLKQTWGYENTLQWMNVVHGRVLTTLELVTDTIRISRDQIEGGRGARFGDPFLDAMREILRYLNAVPSWVPVVNGLDLPTSTYETSQRIRVEALICLFKALGVKPDELALLAQKMPPE